jgi:hypothetical protein
VRSDSIPRHNLQRLAGSYCKRELYAGCSPSRVSKFDCFNIPGGSASLTGSQTHPHMKTYVYSQPSISGTALSGRKLIRVRFCVRFDTFHKQNMQHSELSCKRELYACLIPSRISKFACNGILLCLRRSCALPIQSLWAKQGARQIIYLNFERFDQHTWVNI